MDSLYAIGLGLALRVVVDAVSQHNFKVGGTLVGIWEGIVLYHFLGKMPRSFDPYVAYGFRLFVDFLFTESLPKMAIVILWTGVGVLLSDVAPVLWKDSNLRRLYRRTWVKLPRLPLVPKVAIPTRRTVQFWDSPPTPSSAASDITDSPTTILPVPPPRSYFRSRSLTPPRLRTPSRSPVVPRRSRQPPGAFSTWSETGTEVSVTQPSTSANSDETSDSGTATPPRYSRMLDIPAEDERRTAEIVSALVDADGITDSQSNSITLPPAEDTFHVVDHDEVQPAFDQVPVIPDNDSSSTLLPIPPMPIPVIPNFSTTDSSAPDLVSNRLSVVPEGEVSAADVPIPPSDNMTLPPPPDEWDNIPDNDIPDRRSYASEMTLPETVLTGGRNSIITRANLLREQAEQEEKLRAELEAERRKLNTKGDVKGAFLLKEKIDKAENTAKKLHEKAERRYFTGTFFTTLFPRSFIHIPSAVYNKDPSPTSIDVHQLKVPEAIRRTEMAIRDVLLKGGSELRVITAGKVTSVNAGQVIKGTHLAIIGAMQE